MTLQEASQRMLQINAIKDDEVVVLTGREWATVQRQLLELEITVQDLTERMSQIISGQTQPVIHMIPANKGGQP